MWKTTAKINITIILIIITIIIIKIVIKYGCKNNEIVELNMKFILRYIPNILIFALLVYILNDYIYMVFKTLWQHTILINKTISSPKM